MKKHISILLAGSLLIQPALWAANSQQADSVITTEQVTALSEVDQEIENLSALYSELVQLEEQIEIKKIRIRQSTEVVTFSALVSIFGIVSMWNGQQMIQNGARNLGNMTTWLGYISTFAGISTVAGGSVYIIKLAAMDIPRLEQAITDKKKEIGEQLTDMNKIKLILHGRPTQKV